MLNHKAVLTIFLAALAAGNIFAQSDVGAVFSPSHVGAAYSRDVSEDAFWDITAGVDIGSMVLKQDREPGVSATFSYDFVIGRWRGRSGSSRLFAGPGVSLGYVHDKDKPFGLMAGVSGVLGYEYAFRIPVTVGVGITPTIGVHVGRNGGGMLMEVYRNGLTWSLAPQVSLRYSLGGAGRTAGLRGGLGRGNEKGSGGGSERGTAAFSSDSGAAGGNPDEAAQGSASKRRRDWPLVTYGAEWGYSVNVDHAYHHNYTSTVGRMDFIGHYICYRSNAFVMIHGGINCGRHLNLSLYGGYEGIYYDQAVWPVSIRGTWLFGREPSAARWLAFLDGGWAISSSDHRAGAIAKAGAGYRIPLSRSVKLDFMLSLQFARAEIDIYDDGGAQVSAERIRRNDNYFSGINLSIGLTL